MNTPSNTITVSLHRIQRGHGTAFTSQPPRAPIRRPARIAVMLALAHSIQAAMADGRVLNQADAARLLDYTPARMTQLLDLLLLAPDLQEQILGLEAVDGKQPLVERHLREVVRLTSWVEQRVAFDARANLASSSTSSPAE